MFTNIYYIIVNVIAYAMFYVDKQRAVNKEWRVSEKTLLTLIFVGGFIGAYSGMRQFHHKTRKTSFKFALISAFILHAFLVF